MLTTPPSWTQNFVKHSTTSWNKRGRFSKLWFFPSSLNQEVDQIARSGGVQQRVDLFYTSISLHALPLDPALRGSSQHPLSLAHMLSFRHHLFSSYPPSFHFIDMSTRHVAMLHVSARHLNTVALQFSWTILTCWWITAMSLPKTKSWGLKVPGRPLTPCEGAAQVSPLSRQLSVIGQS